MAFGRTNTPSTFQDMMNAVLQNFLRRFVLVFLDDILIYNASWAEHLRHIRAVFQVLRANKLTFMQCKCTFDARLVAYLGHIITGNDITMDPAKIEAVQTWPALSTVRALRGFLGLTGYYHKFIQDYGVVTHPLTQLLKKDAFCWSPDADAAFTVLMTALTHGPVLQLPDFDRRFIINCDASGLGFGAVLHQDDGPITFYSCPVAPHRAKLAPYKRELISLVKAVRHWRLYLWVWSFTVCTDHIVLKFLLDQRLSTIPQHNWVSKLFSYDFTMSSIQGRTTLSRMPCLAATRTPCLHVPCLTWCSTSSTSSGVRQQPFRTSPLSGSGSRMRRCGRSGPWSTA
jgi:hypothetical protein